jgi:hypothetical protein
MTDHPPTEPELKFERFKTFLLQHTEGSHRELVEQLHFSLFMTLVASFATPHYMDLHRFASDPSFHTEEGAHAWVRDFIEAGKVPQAMVKDAIETYERRAAAEDIVKTARYLEYFCRIIFERFGQEERT